MEKREKIIVRAGCLGILMNVLLVVSKGAVGFLSGSLAIVLDALNNLTDVLSATVTIVGAKLAGRKPDKNHPFGHGRVEYLATVIVGVIILAAGLGALFNAVPKILNPELAEYSLVTLLTLTSAILVKLGFGQYAKRKGREVNSRSLEATGVDALCDAMLTFGTLVSAVVAILFKVSIDGVVGAIISAFIIRTGIEILGEGWVDIVGRRVDAKLSRKIKRKLMSYPEVKEVLELVLHSYGSIKVVGAAKIKVSREMKVGELEKLTKKIEKEVSEEEQVELIVGV